MIFSDELTKLQYYFHVLSTAQEKFFNAISNRASYSRGGDFTNAEYEKLLPDLTQFDPSLLTNILFMSKYLKTPLKAADIKLLNVDFMNTPEMLFEMIDKKRTEIFHLIKPENRNESLFNDFNTTGILSEICRYDFFKGQPFLSELSQKTGHANALTKLCLEHPKAVLSMPSELITDNFIHNYLLEYSSDTYPGQSSFIFNQRSPEWWIDNYDILKIYLKAQANSNSAKVSFNNFDINNHQHETLALLISTQSPSVIKKYLDKFGSNMENIERVIGAEIYSHYQKAPMQFDLKTLFSTPGFFNDYYQNEIDTLKNIDTLPSADSDFTFSRIQEKLIQSYNEVEKYLLKQEKTNHPIFNLSGSGNYLALFKYFNNPSKYTEEQVDKIFDHIHNTVITVENPTGLLCSMFSFSDKYSHTNSYRFSLLPYISTRWDIEKKDLQKFSKSDFYNTFTAFSLAKEMKEEVDLHNTSNTPTTFKVRKF